MCQPNLGNISIPCHVLENEDRVLSGRGMQNSLGFSKNSSGLELVKFVNTKLKKFLGTEVMAKLQNPVVFKRILSAKSVFTAFDSKFLGAV